MRPLQYLSNGNMNYFDKYLLIINALNGKIIKKVQLSRNETKLSPLIVQGYNKKLYVGLSYGIMMVKT